MFDSAIPQRVFVVVESLGRRDRAARPPCVPAGVTTDGIRGRDDLAD